MKPETPADRKLASVCRDARLTFIYLWTIADDDGLFRAEPRQLLGDLYPFDADVAVEILGDWLAELVHIGAIRWRWTRDGARVGQIVNWTKHQKIDHRSKSFLLTELVEDTETLASPARDPREPVTTESRDPRPRSLEPRVLSQESRTALVELRKTRNSTTQRRGRGLTDIIAHLGTVLHEVGTETDRRVTREEVRKVAASLVFAYWAKRTGHERALLDAKRETRIGARLRENGDNVHELLYAIDGYSKDGTLRRAEQDNGAKYDGIQTLFRDREMVERLAGHCPGWRERVPHPMAEKYLGSNGTAGGDA